MKTKVNQEHYPDFEVDNSEPDVIQFVSKEADSQIIFIERDKIFELIQTLKKYESFR